MSSQVIQPQMINSKSDSDSAAVTSKTPIHIKVLTVLGMVTLMGGTLTGVMTFINLGYTDSFFNDWISSFLLAIITVMPIGFLMMTLLTKLSEKLMPNSAEKTRNILVGISMALIMESGMALSTTINNIGLASDGIILAWFNTLIAALPIALVMMITVSLTIKPKVEALLKS
ncbi:DUF2798 domain-containing protein [Shewanella olleyana]|uniref:DUF2798 domain-containing protein n=1 Tax=Shewanella olleyana TaxID=135626 RepID=UPI00200C660A|nr:DUF2798 domain-containing protein [Shewanella olleyana]MCL1065316.1 DUF2798 domain-containing protein [Shewanella olleyana]